MVLVVVHAFLLGSHIVLDVEFSVGILLYPIKIVLLVNAVTYVSITVSKCRLQIARVHVFFRGQDFNVKYARLMRRIVKTAVFLTLKVVLAFVSIISLVLLVQSAKAF